MQDAIASMHGGFEVLTDLLVRTVDDNDVLARMTWAAHGCMHDASYSVACSGRD